MNLFLMSSFMFAGVYDRSILLEQYLKQNFPQDCVVVRTRPRSNYRELGIKRRTLPIPLQNEVS